MTTPNLQKLQCFLLALKIARKDAADTALREGADAAEDMDMEDEEEEKRTLFLAAAGDNLNEAMSMIKDFDEGGEDEGSNSTNTGPTHRGSSRGTGPMGRGGRGGWGEAARGHIRGQGHSGGHTRGQGHSGGHTGGHTWNITGGRGYRTGRSWRGGQRGPGGHGRW